MRLGEALLHLGDRAGARAQLEEALELAHSSPLAQHLLFLVYGVLLQVPDEAAEALSLIERAETLFDPRWICRFCPTGYHVAAATGARAPASSSAPASSCERAERGGGRWRAVRGRRRWRRRGPSCCSPRAAERAAADALRRAAEGYAAAGQLLNERRARETLERLRRARSAPRKVSGRRAGDAAGMQTNTTVGDADPEELEPPHRELHRAVANDGRRDHGDRLMVTVGPIGRLGRYTATHFRVVLAAWIVVALALGVLRAARRDRRSPAPAGRRPARSRSRPAS